MFSLNVTYSLDGQCGRKEKQNGSFRMYLEHPGHISASHFEYKLPQSCFTNGHIHSPEVN